MSDQPEVPEGFTGRARLFPLPNLVLFPHVVQPLHIFEPRYRQMTADALQADKRIALVLPRAGWEADYEGTPALHDVACLGEIVADQSLEDGCYNLLLRGLSRVRIRKEVTHDRLYRLAQVELLPERPVEDLGRQALYRSRLIELAPRLLPQAAPVQEEFAKILKGGLPAATLGDLVAFALPLDSAFKQTLLEELDVERRLQRLIEHLETLSAGPIKVAGQSFPPKFSAN
jgi:Lon protease-like protein